jgi:hypothetical protein
VRKSLLSIFIVLFLLSSETLYAAERVPLGTDNISFKADYIKLTDSNPKDADANFNMNNWRVGGQIGFIF